MVWYRWKRWRFAWSPNKGPVIDGDGIWVHLFAGLFFLRTRAI